MRFVLSTVLVALALGWNGASAQSAADFTRCRGIADDALRLACYDAIPFSPSASIGKYQPVELEELKAFALSYRGDLIEVTGWIVADEGDLLRLGADAADDRPIPVDSSAIERRSRQAFLDACGDGCRAKVQGRVRPLNFTTGIVADTLAIE